MKEYQKDNIFAVLVIIVGICVVATVIATIVGLLT